MRIIGRLLVGLLALIGLLTVFLAILIGSGFWWLMDQLPTETALPERIVLSADLRDALAEVPGPNALRAFDLDRGLGLSDVVLALDRAAADPRVSGLVARVEGAEQGYAATQELRDAVARFRASGRFALAFADSFGELTPANQGYMLATAFEEISLQPVGMVGLTGVMAEVPFAKGLLDRLGIGLAIGKREQYKTAFDSLSETGLTAANQVMLDSMLGSLEGQLVAAVATGRGLAPGQVQSLIDGGPYTDREALAAGLVDRLGYWDEVMGEARSRGGTVVSLDAYAAGGGGERLPGATTVAFFRAEGPIGPSGGGLGASIASDPLAAAIEAAIDAQDVKALLLRIDSPGGSAVASETIARQLRRARAAGKPVIVSMGNTAASGGYWIAMDATTIVAQPATLTGSIGVLGGKPVLAGLWEQLDVSWAQLPRAENADFWSFNSAYDPAGRARLDSLLDALYGSFKEGVARGRGLDVEEVQEIAQGRVWTGEQALELGLVDRLGGLQEAAAAVREALQLPEDAALELRPYPEPISPIREALSFLGEQWGVLARTQGIVAGITGGGTARLPPLSLR